MVEQQPPVVVMQQEKKGISIFKIIASIVLIISLITLGFYGVSWSMSEIGQQKIADFKNLLATRYNPFYWYGEKLKEAQETGSIWKTEQNLTAEKVGITFNSFESVGNKIVPSGSLLAFRYKFDVGEGVHSLPLKLECILKKQGGDALSEQMLIESKDYIPSEKPAVSTDNPLSYSNIVCQVNTKTQSEDSIVIAEGKVSFPFNQRNSLKVYFTEDTVNIGEKFFEKYNIKETLPIMAKYNNEPVELGLGVSDENIQPVIIGENQFPAIGISLKNRWDGKVTKLNSMSLILPAGVRINKENSPPSLLCPFNEAEESTTFMKYKAEEKYLSQASAFGKALGEVLPTYQRFFCWLDIDENILENNPYNIKQYSVDVSYEYEFQPRSETITLKAFTGTEEKPEAEEKKYYLCHDETLNKYSCTIECKQEFIINEYSKNQECEEDLLLYKS